MDILSKTDQIELKIVKDHNYEITQTSKSRKFNSVSYRPRNDSANWLEAKFVPGYLKIRQ